MLRRLSSLPLAIGELGVIAALSAIGTVIEQNKDPDFYIKVRFCLPIAVPVTRFDKCLFASCAHKLEAQTHPGEGVPVTSFAYQSIAQNGVDQSRSL